MTEELEEHASDLKPLDLKLKRFRLGDAVIYPVENRIEVSGKSVTIVQKDMDVLVYLAERSHMTDAIWSKDIVSAVWDKDAGSDTAVTHCVHGIRAALGDDAKSPKYVKTLPRKGYLLVQNVVIDPVKPVSIQSNPPIKSHWLLLGVGLIVTLAVATLIKKSSEVEPPQVKTGPPYSLAILPLRSELLDEPLDSLGESISEDLIITLGKIGGFELVSRRTSLNLGKQNVDAIGIGELLDVAYIVDGRVTQRGGQLYVDAEMAETRFGRQIWANTFTYDVNTVTSAPGDIAKQVAAALAVVLGTQEQEEIEQVKTRSPEAHSLFLQARKLLRGPRDEAALSQAVDLFSEAVVQDAEFANAQAGICQSFVALYDIKQSTQYFDQAEATCQQLAQTSPNMVQAKIALGTLYRERGDLEASIRTLGSVVDALPGNIEAKVELGDSLFAAGRKADALKVYLRAVELAPNEYDAQAALGVFYYRNERYREARKHFIRAVALNPTSATPLNSLAAAHYQLDEIEAAGRVWRKSLGIQPTRTALTNLGIVKYYLNDFVEAEQYQRRALQTAPDDHRILGRLAESIRLLPDRADESRSIYEDADRAAITRIAENPSDAWAHARLANFRVHLGDTSKMASLFATAHELAPDDDVIFYIEAVSWASLGNIDETVRCLTQARALGFSPRLIREDPDIRALADHPSIAPFLAAQ